MRFLFKIPKPLTSSWFLGLFSLIGYSYFSYENGLISQIYNADITYISSIIPLLGILAFLNLGRLIFVKEFKMINPDSYDLDPGYEIANWCIALGLLGTVIGIIVMSASFQGISLSNIHQVQRMFSQVLLGMSTALYTTVVGLSIGLFTSINYYILGRICKCEKE